MASRTFGQLQQAVQDEGYGTDTALIQGRLINAEYERLAGRRRWKWLEAQDSTLSTAIGVATYAIPMTNFRTIDAVRITENDGITTHYIEPMLEQDLRDEYHRTLGTNGQPAYWTQYAGKLWLTPTPDKIYVVTFDYIKNVVPMANPNDTHLVPEAYDDIMVWGTVARMAVRTRDWLTRNFALQERDAQETAMISEMQMLNRQRSDLVEDRLWGSR